MIVLVRCVPQSVGPRESLRHSSPESDVPSCLHPRPLFVVPRENVPSVSPLAGRARVAPPPMARPQPARNAVNEATPPVVAPARTMVSARASNVPPVSMTANALVRSTDPAPPIDPALVNAPHRLVLRVATTETSAVSATSDRNDRNGPNAPPVVTTALGTPVRPVPPVRRTATDRSEQNAPSAQITANGPTVLTVPSAVTVPAVRRSGALAPRVHRAEIVTAGLLARLLLPVWMRSWSATRERSSPRNLKPRRASKPWELAASWLLRCASWVLSRRSRFSRRPFLSL